jgi:hypothetical protein
MGTYESASHSITAWSTLLLFLTRSVLVASCLSYILVGDSKSLYQFSIAVLIFSSFFWVWALVNSIHMEAPNFDYGIVSFVTVMCTSSFGLGLASAKVQPSLLAKSMTIGSHILVALNYLLGSLLGFLVLERPGFGVYCAVFVGIWVGIAYRAFSLMKSSTGGEEARPFLEV